LKQEGWRYELASKNDSIVYNGIVYNEMKGVYSSLDYLLDSVSTSSLFPNNSYFYDTGGNPKEIPNLSHEELRAFYEEFYSPTNALIAFWVSASR
jgi:presequence protease